MCGSCGALTPVELAQTNQRQITVKQDHFRTGSKVSPVSDEI